MRLFSRRVRRRRGQHVPATTGEFAIRVSTVDELFEPFDARALAERALRYEVRQFLLDEWELARPDRAVLHVRLPAAQRAVTDERDVRDAIRGDFRSYTRPFRKANPLTRHDRLAIWAGILIFLLTIAVSTALDRESKDVLTAGISQAIVVIGWVALWDPAARIVSESVPHHYTRKRYAELTEVELVFDWQQPPGAATSSLASAGDA
jgi:hypothetical protein